jgi:hypothetical protein
VLYKQSSANIKYGKFLNEELLASQEELCYGANYDIIYDMIYLLTAIGLTPGGSSTVHIYTQRVHRTTKKK